MKLLEDFIDNIDNDDLTTEMPDQENQYDSPYDRTVTDDWFICLEFNTVQMQSLGKTSLSRYIRVKTSQLNRLLDINPYIESHSGIEWTNSFLMYIDKDFKKKLPNPPFGLSGTFACFTFTEKFSTPAQCLKFMSSLYQIAADRFQEEGRQHDVLLYRTNHLAFNYVEEIGDRYNIEHINYIYYLMFHNEYDKRSGRLSRFPYILQGCVPFIPEISTYEYVAELTGDDNMTDIMDDTIFRQLNGMSGRKPKKLQVSKRLENMLERSFITGNALDKFQKDDSAAVMLYAYESIKPRSKTHQWTGFVYQDSVAVLNSIKRDIMMTPVRCLDWKMKTTGYGADGLHIVIYLGVYKFDDALFDAFISISTVGGSGMLSSNKPKARQMTEHNVMNFVRNLCILLGDDIDRDFAVETIVKGIEKNARI